MDEETLSELLDLIAGRGKWRHIGGGFRTFPGQGENEDKLHAAVKELERRGLVRLAWAEKGIECFVATEKP